MKCRYVLDVDCDVSKLPEHEQSLLAFKTDKKGIPVPYFPKGTVREVEDAFKLCQYGIAEPADDECAEALGLNEAEQKDLQRRYQKQLLGIHPDDSALYDAGVMVGYNADGSMKPGPKWDEYQAALKQAEEEEEKDVV